MSYAVYKTDAIILRILPHGEHNRDVVFFTRDLGKISVRVQAGRKSESKMRMQLTRYHEVAIDIVRGRAVWRLVGISELSNHKIFKNPKILHAWNRAIGLAEHLIRGEETHPQLFTFLSEILSWIDQLDFETITPTKASGLELFLVIHVLEKMGYWGAGPISEIPDLELLESMHANKKELVVTINESIEATQIV